LIAAPEGKEIRAMISVYEQRGREEGIERGREEGIAQAKRETLLRLLRRKFGDLPADISSRIEGLSDTAELDRLFDRIIDAASLQEFGILDAPARSEPA
jgi:hypothetical protein